MYATLDGYRVGWSTGKDELLLVSVGTGLSDPSQTPSQVAAKGAIRALFSLMDDCAALVETLLQWMSSSPTARPIDRELGTLDKDLLGGAPLLSYLRYNVLLTPEEVTALAPGLDPEQAASLGAMDDPDNMDVLMRLGEAAAARDVRAADFAAAFDLRA